MSYKDLFTEKTKDKSARLLSSDYKKFEKKGDQVIGRLLTINEVSGQMGGKSYRQYLFQTDDGLVKCAFGSATDNEAGALMAVGGVYSVVYNGQEKLKGGRNINRFEILELQTAGEGGFGGEGELPF